MEHQAKRIKFPELFYGIVSPIGVDNSDVMEAIKRYLLASGYTVRFIKVTDAYKIFSKKFRPWKKLDESGYEKRLDTYISYGNQLRKTFEDPAILAKSSLFQINDVRRSIIQANKMEENYKNVESNAYIITQFKRSEEVELFRFVYKEQFTQISTYSRRENRIEWLSRKFASDEAKANFDDFRSKAEDFVRRDFNEVGEPYGQRLSKIFHDADLIVSLDVKETAYEQVRRFLDLQFGSNLYSPTKFEYGMYLAKAASLRSLDLSRQVGAAIFSRSTEIISLGSNEVPKALGGTYWCDDDHDDREYRHKFDSNDTRKIEIFKQMYNFLKSEGHLSEVKFEDLVLNKNVSELRMMDALEYGRIVHAEMNAITDAARTGRAVQNATLYCTTFPCHMCAKHIVAAGLSKVIFLEPYPKSLAKDLHSDAIQIEGSDRAKFNNFPAVSFEHFYGITPRLYKELFQRGKRKGSRSELEEFISNEKKPNIQNTMPFYILTETSVVMDTKRQFFTTKYLRKNEGVAEE